MSKHASTIFPASLGQLVMGICGGRAQQFKIEIKSNVVGCRGCDLSQAVLGVLHQGRGGHCSESGDGDYVGDGDERRNH